MAKKEEPKVDEKVEKLKIKKPKKFATVSDEAVKIDMSKPVTPAEESIKVDLSKPVEKVVVEPSDTPVMEEVTNEPEEVQEVAEILEKEIVQSIEAGRELPDNVQKLMSFMDDTGGDLKDYVKLNQDYSEMDNQSLLKEYYKRLKSKLPALNLNWKRTNPNTMRISKLEAS